jgi:hypothetical protein
MSHITLRQSMMRASPTGNRTTPGLHPIAVLLYARSTLYHNQSLRSRARKPVVPPQKTLRPAKLHRGRLEAMHAAIRQSHLPLPPLPTHTNSTTRKRLNSLWMIVRPIAWWCLQASSYARFSTSPPLRLSCTRYKRRKITLKKEYGSGQNMRRM